MSQLRVKKRFDFSRYVRKLHLERGDILVCTDPHLGKALSEMKFPYLTFQVPIIVAPLGLEAIKPDDLLAIARRARETSQLIIPGKI